MVPQNQAEQIYRSAGDISEDAASLADFREAIVFSCAKAY